MKDKGPLQLCLLIIIQLNICMGSPDSLSNVSTIEPPGPWSEILENWVVSDSGSFRTSKVMKLGDKTLMVSSKISSPNKREVSETDLYLLGAIEKLVYRVDFLENRLRRAEELLYYVISGNTNQKPSCPANYTKIGQYCYHFSDREFDWKSSSSLCRGMGGYLIEFEKDDEKRDVFASLQTNSKLKGKHFWTGGLNPGLLWIWASSAKPVHQNTKQTVPGDGRCLKLSYNSTSRLYSYQSDDCGARHRYACKLTVDDESANRIEKTARMLIDGQP
ncbi:PREDICTED: C-type lectin domain family 9 member A [Dufourea novaeangliae]|uniref:C-type lectin domain family 9 member A n=1 Tax=Dufourea novaeangliae TaxID=178035 RepID=UPI0007679849|nr:PREDICTED: C-type lectin domain family 9 member A [Dufourea novaeangliae]